MKKPTNVEHVNNLIGNLKHVKILIGIHEHLTGNGRGNRSSVNVLNKSAVVLLVACWEVFIEEIGKVAFEYMLRNSKSHNVFPDNVLFLISDELKRDQNPKSVWSLAGEGWKDLLSTHKEKVLQKYLGNFNTAKTEPIDDLFKNLIGFRVVSKNWQWKGMPNETATKHLNDLVGMRGDIAHKINTNKPVLKNDLIGHINFIQRLAAITSNRVRIYLKERTGSYPWGKVSYGNIS